MHKRRVTQRLIRAVAVGLVLALSVAAFPGPAHGTVMDGWDWAKAIGGFAVTTGAGALGASAPVAGLLGLAAVAVVDLEERLQPYRTEIQQTFWYSGLGS